MHRIRTLFVRFARKIPDGLIPAFRGAVIETVGRENTMYHNHLGDDMLLYSYPLVQYKTVNGHPCVYFVNTSLEATLPLISKSGLSINLAGREYRLEIEELHTLNFDLEVTPAFYRYELRNWLPLNDVNLRKFNSTPEVEAKVALLDKLLTGNMLSMAKGLGWHINEQIHNRIMEVKTQKELRFKNRPFVAFDLVFESNVKLPQYMGLGKSASHGYGTLTGLLEEHATAEY